MLISRYIFIFIIFWSDRYHYFFFFEKKFCIFKILKAQILNHYSHFLFVDCLNFKRIHKLSSTLKCQLYPKCKMPKKLLENNINLMKLMLCYNTNLRILWLRYSYYFMFIFFDIHYIRQKKKIHHKNKNKLVCCGHHKTFFDINQLY